MSVIIIARIEELFSYYSNSDIFITVLYVMVPVFSRSHSLLMVVTAVHEIQGTTYLQNYTGETMYVRSFDILGHIVYKSVHHIHEQHTIFNQCPLHFVLIRIQYAMG